MGFQHKPATPKKGNPRFARYFKSNPRLIVGEQKPSEQSTAWAATSPYSRILRASPSKHCSATLIVLIELEKNLRATHYFKVVNGE